MWFRTNGLTGMITGSGQINLLSGQIWIRYVVRAHESVVPRRRPAGPRRPRRGFGPNAGFKIRNSFLFQIYFINYKSN
jgi:hypothetical protein